MYEGKFIILGGFLPGTDAEESLSHLQEWLDTIAIAHSTGCLATDGDGHRLPGHYHQMTGVEADDFLGELSRQLDSWGAYCERHNLSCGSILKISAGSGRGHMKLVSMKIGPFKG